jgi:hypothetical protein
MAITNLSYTLSSGFIHNWLVAGPELIPVEKLSSLPQDNLELAILRNHYAADPGVTEIPVDLGPLKTTDENTTPLLWHYYRCTDDHFIDLTSTYKTCHYLRAWAYVQVSFPAAQEVILVMTSNGPADLWLNGKHVRRQEHFSKQFPVSVRFPVTVALGANEFLLRFENTAIRETPFVLALKIEGDLGDGVNVIIPTDIDADKVETWQKYEEVIQKAYLEKYVYGHFTGDKYDKNEPITVRFSRDLKVVPPLQLTYRLQSLNQDIFQEGNRPTDAKLVYDLASTFPLRNGPHHLALLPPADEFYVKKIRVEKHDLFFVVRTPYSPNAFGIYKDRRHEALEQASIRRAENLYTEIAKMALGTWEKIDRNIITGVIANINHRHAGCVADVIGLVGVLFRFSRKKEMPKELKREIETCILNFKYWQDEPGEDIMDFESESQQILFHTAELLAGQLYPEGLFTNSNQSGQWHRKKGERLAKDWLNAHAAYGWQDWDANTGFAEEIASLSYLVDLAVSGTINELASILMDKMFFTLAINSYQGSFGSTHGQSDTASILSSRLEATSGLSRLMWGMGNYNEFVMGTVSLACMKNYDFPDLLKSIATRKPDAFWDRERHGSAPEKGASTPACEVNKVTFKTSHYMLSSAQVYHPGEKGSAQHIWQATLGPDAIVFTNHPASFSHDDAHRPNFWRGNASLPSVAQWGDVLVAQYQLPEDDWLGFTHAYFPIKAFDEYHLEGHWAFARKGKGYLALYTSCGYKPVNQGQSAYRELRSYGKENTWVCQMGQELLDGSFEDFQKKVLALDVVIEGSVVRLHSLRNDDIIYNGSTSLSVNGQEQSLSDYKHYESTLCIAEYPAQQMDITVDDQGMRLKLNE